MLTSGFVHFKLFHLTPPTIFQQSVTETAPGGRSLRKEGVGMGAGLLPGQDIQAVAVTRLPSAGFDTSILPICKDSLGWMFNKLDMNYDLLLDHSEINAIYLDKYEPCIKPLFNSCDSFKDGKLSNNEWCYCFQKPGGKAGGRLAEPRAAMQAGLHWGGRD